MGFVILETKQLNQWMGPLMGLIVLKRTDMDAARNLAEHAATWPKSIEKDVSVVDGYAEGLLDPRIGISYWLPIKISGYFYLCPDLIIFSEVWLRKFFAGFTTYVRSHR